VLKNLGGICFDLGYFKLAQQYGESSLEISKKLGYPNDIMNAAFLLPTSYFKPLNNKK
jgi:hypothetical protein